MANDWVKTTLGKFTTLQRGHDLPSATRISGNIPILGSFGITGWHNESKVSGPGVTVGRSGASYGVVSYSEVDYWPLNTALFVKDFHGNHPKFAYYFLKSMDFERYNSGSAVQSLNRNHIHPIEISIPPLPEQKAIAHILGSLDDKIELNRQMNETLEAMAQALFKSWFVDFDPVIDNALAAGNAIPDELLERAEQRKEVEKKDHSDINTLFPDDFELTEGMGWIPKGWEVTSFTELAVLDTASVKPNSEPEKIWEHFSIPSFDINATPAFDTGESIKSNKYKVNANAILVSKLNPETERIWWVNIQDADSAVCSTEFMQFIPKNFNHRAFIYSLLRSEYFRAEILSRVTGSTGSHQRTQPKSVAVIDVLKPNDELVSKFSQIALDWKIRVSENIEQDAILAKLRDILLPKLMSGELRIPDAEALANEAI